MNIRKAKAEDAANILDWGEREKSVNLFDREVLYYPTTETLCVENGKPICYLPAQVVPMIESIILNPDATILERGKAIRKAIDGLLESAYKDGMREAYFVCESQDMVDYAQRVGFEKLEWPVCRIRLGENRESLDAAND